MWNIKMITEERLGRDSIPAESHECLSSEALNTTVCFKARGKVGARLHLPTGSTQTC